LSRERLNPIRLCADDYGLAPGIGIAIRTLLKKQRLTSVSCFASGEYWREEAALLKPFGGTEWGLHLTVDEPSLWRLSMKTLRSKRNGEAVLAQWETQLKAFRAELGRDPQYLDGHRHIHQLPGIRPLFETFYRRHFANTQVWVRVVAPWRSPRPRVARARCFGLTLAGAPFRRRMRQANIPFLESGGYYDFGAKNSYDSIFRKMLRSMQAGELFVCHPGIVDKALTEVDDLFNPREREFEFFNGENFPEALKQQGFAIKVPTSF